MTIAMPEIVQQAGTRFANIVQFFASTSNSRDDFERKLRPFQHEMCPHESTEHLKDLNRACRKYYSQVKANRR
jgi:hypothetical protein